MDTWSMASCVVTLVALAGPSPAAKDKDGFVSMFNGKDLTGWQGKEGAWSVVDGAITGESTPQRPCPRSHYLYWKGGQPGDFILRCKIKLVGGNSGVQFRSKARANFDTFGYQADFDAAHRYTGALYQHARGLVVNRGFRAEIAEDGNASTKRFADPKELARKVHDKDWNDYELTAVGPKITLRINRVLMSEAVDHHKKHALKKGIIALQMHQGPPMRVQFKDLRIKILDKNKAGGKK